MPALPAHLRQKIGAYINPASLFPRARSQRVVRRRSGLNSRKIRKARYIPVISPRTLTVKLRYSIPFSTVLSSTASNVGENLFRANSVYDPDLTGVGLQPRGFDQYMALFDHFCVMGSQITACFQFLTGSATANSGQCSVMLNDSDTTAETYTKIQEARYRKIRPINSATSNAVVIKLNYSTRRFFGRRGGDILNDKTLSGASNANPTEDAIFHCMYYSLASTSSTVYLTGYIDYIVTFHEPKQPAQS